MRLIARLEGAKPWSFTWLAARLERFALPRSDGVVCITNYTRDAVAALAKRTWLLPNAVDENFFRIDSKPDSNQPPVILCVGAVCLRKNQNAFIRALDPLAAQMKFQLVFLGQAAAGDPYGDEFLQLVASRAWCLNAGFADREKLRTQFKAASLLALPSLEDNCPMVVLEAMAAGVPVVAAKVGGVPDLVDDGRTGLFCDPLAAESMASVVAKLLRDPAFGRALAADAKRQAMERFHPRTIARRHVEIYREVLETRRSKR
jgi:glycosyltransferase involved in cell wall biosynthesis